MAKNIEKGKEKMQTINKDEFLKQLKSVSIGVSSKEVLEQTACFLFNKGQISTFNDIIMASILTDLQIQGVTPADELLKLLKEVKDEEIKIGQEDSKIIIKGKRFKAEFNTSEDVKDYLDEYVKPDKFVKLPKNFCSLVNLACMTAGTSLAEPLLMCIHIKDNIIESCDNDRITICELDKKLKMDVLVPAKSIAEIIKQDIISIACTEGNDGWLSFKEKGGAILSCRLVNEEYINLKKYIPKEKGKKIVFPEQLKIILNRADIFSKKEVTAEKMVKVNLSDKGLKLTSQNSLGKYTERKKLKYKGPEITFEINPDFLRDVLSLSNTITIVDKSLLFKDNNSIHMVKLEE